MPSTGRAEARAALCFIERTSPYGALRDDEQELPIERAHVRITGAHRLPGVPVRVGRLRRVAEQVQHPVPAVGPVVAQRLPGPLPRDEDPPAGIAEVFGPMRPAPTRAGPETVAGVARLDPVPEPVRAALRTRLPAQDVQEPSQVLALPIGLGSMAVGQTWSDTSPGSPSPGWRRPSRRALRARRPPQVSACVPSSRICSATSLAVHGPDPCQIAPPQPHGSSASARSTSSRAATSR